MRFDKINLANANLFFIFFQVCPFIVVNFNQKYETSDDILKVHYLVKRLTLRLIKSYKNYHGYY